MNLLRKIRRWFARRSPGSVANIAMRKRQLVNELRATGHSIKCAKTIVSQRFRSHE